MNNKIQYYLYFIFIIFICILLASCHHKFDKKLGEKDKKYLRQIGLLDNEEVVIYFESHGGICGIKQSGNFITNKRIATYWIDKNRVEKTSIESAYYKEIDTIITEPRITSLTYASALKIITKKHHTFKVYIDEDSTQTWKFFNEAINRWKKSK